LALEGPTDPVESCENPAAILRQVGNCADDPAKPQYENRFSGQRTPWKRSKVPTISTKSYHNHVQDTFYVLKGNLRIEESSATFLVLQGIGEYDFVPLV
jgi:hypothetical protein